MKPASEMPRRRRSFGARHCEVDKGRTDTDRCIAKHSDENAENPNDYSRFMREHLSGKGSSAMSEAR